MANIITPSSTVSTIPYPTDNPINAPAPNAGLSFPPPKTTSTPRQPGQGCIGSAKRNLPVCVHQYYCTTLYWFRRYNEKDPDEHVGIGCASWSINEADRIKVIRQGDIDYNASTNDAQIATEPTQNGILDDTTGDSRNSGVGF